MNSSLLKRVITTVVALPTLLGVVVLLPYYNYLAFTLLVIAISVINNYEMFNMLTKDKNLDLKVPFWLGSLLPLVTYVQLGFFPDYDLISLVLILLVLFSLSLEIHYGHIIDNYKGSRDRMAISICLLLYPSILSIYFIHLCFLENAWVWIITFLGLCFASDTFAYVFGMIFGRSNKGIVKVSPNKSVAGYVAGILIPGLIGLLLTSIFSIYNLTPIQGFILGLLTAFGAAIGDLIESCFKRSAGVKDSGNVIPGRGGMMDSIDSLIVAAPIFYFAVSLMI
ncbi:MAG: phosphatidate cytidylyltransferase [Sphaerochaetaceae bacterium]|nr:phosphatidate cytidylyltransferase [Sphaerochaetaceae bacterium]